jgi:hypothetical protein
LKSLGGNFIRVVTRHLENLAVVGTRLLCMARKGMHLFSSGLAVPKYKTVYKISPKPFS